MAPSSRGDIAGYQFDIGRYPSREGVALRGAALRSAIVVMERPGARREVILPDGRHISERYRMPDGEPLQVWPILGRGDFESEDDFLAYTDEFTRFNNYLAPRGCRLREQGDPHVAPPDGRAPTRRSRSASCQVGLRLSPPDHRLLEKLAAAHLVKPGTMARILVARGVRAAFSEDG